MVKQNKTCKTKNDNNEAHLVTNSFKWGTETEMMDIGNLLCVFMQVKY